MLRLVGVVANSDFSEGLLTEGAIYLKYLTQTLTFTKHKGASRLTLPWT